MHGHRLQAARRQAVPLSVAGSPAGGSGPVSSEQEEGGSSGCPAGLRTPSAERRRTCSDARGQRAQPRPSRDRRPEALRRQRGRGSGTAESAGGELSAERGPGPPQTGKPETETGVKPGGGEQEGPSVGGAVPASAPGGAGAVSSASAPLRVPSAGTRLMPK